MAEGTKRRPLPALIGLVALTLLTALVWWRVLHRSDSGAAAQKPCPSPSAPAVLPQPATVSLKVYNATTRTGLAKATGGVLAKDGFKILDTQNDPANLPILGIAEIRFSADQKDAAALLSYYFPGARMVPLDASSDSSLAVSLGTKFKAVALSRVVQAAMSSAHVTLQPVGRSASPRAPSSTC